MLSFKTCIFYHLLWGVLIPLICPFQFILLTQLPKHIPRFIVMSPLLTHFGLINLLHSLVRWLLFFRSTSYTKVILRFCHCESWYIWFLKLVLELCAADQSFCTALEVPPPYPLPCFLPIHSRQFISLFSLLYFFGSFASSTFTVPFSPTFLSNTSSKFLTTNLDCFLPHAHRLHS